MADTVQMQMIRRYSRLLREQQAKSRGPRIGAKDRRRAARELASKATALPGARPGTTQR
jgi:hypothetical protein